MNPNHKQKPIYQAASEGPLISGQCAPSTLLQDVLKERLVLSQQSSRQLRSIISLLVQHIKQIETKTK